VANRYFFIFTYGIPSPAFPKLSNTRCWHSECPYRIRILKL
jgi:hypothetical protein